MASIDRLARSLVDLRGLIDEITGKGAEVEFLSEGLIFAPGVSDPRSTLLLGVLGSFAEFERAIIHERQAEGIALAKRPGNTRADNGYSPANRLTQFVSEQEPAPGRPN